MDIKVVVLILFCTASAQQEYKVAPFPPQNVFFQLTSHDSFVLAWSTPPGPIDYYLLDYYPAKNTSIQVAINTTETYHEEIYENLNVNTLGINFYSVLDETPSQLADLTVLKEHDIRLPPTITSATKQWISREAIQLQWTLPQGQYDGVLLLYAPQNKDVPAKSVQMEPTETSYKLKNLSRDQQYIIHLYTVRNGIHSDPAVFQNLPDEMHACEANPCKSGGICTEYENDPNMYTCECKPGFEGTLCENNINECAKNPCQNGGQCVDGDNAYTCVCRSGYEGKMCQTPSDGVAIRASVITAGFMFILYGIFEWNIL